MCLDGCEEGIRGDVNSGVNESFINCHSDYILRRIDSITPNPMN